MVNWINVLAFRFCYYPYLGWPIDTEKLEAIARTGFDLQTGYITFLHLPKLLPLVCVEGHIGATNTLECR